MLVDVHCHLTFPEFSNDLDEVVKRARNVMIISSGVGLEDNKKVLELAKKYKNIKAGLGLYPVDALKLDEEGVNCALDFIIKNKNRMVYIGEVGLDYKESNDKERQKEIFSKVIEIAKKIKKPLLVHSRKAELDCVEMLESSGLKNIVFHCFTGKLKLAKRIADNGWSFSIPCIVVKSEGFQEIVKKTDISQLLTETDAPYLGVFPGRNEPGFVKESVNKISELKLLDRDEVENILHMNFQKLFSL